MSMSVSDCTSRCDNNYNSFKDDIYKDYENQNNAFQEQENKRKEEYESKQSTMSNFGQNIGIKSSIPGANNVKIEEEFVPGEFNFNSSITKFFQMLANECDTEFQNATPSLENVDITTPAGTLTFVEQDDPVQNAYEIAKKVSAYWALTIMPTGKPQTVTITTVVNTATTIINPLATEILSLGGVEPTGTFRKLIDTIIKHVKTIVWTVTELDQEQNPITFTVTVS